MNTENIDLVISMLKRIEVQYPQHFNMHHFQQSDDDTRLELEAEEVIRDCGTECCFSGWLNIAEEFTNFPGKVNSDSSFTLEGLTEIESIAKLLSVDTSLSNTIIYPYYRDSYWNKVWGKYKFQLNDNFTDYDWLQIKPCHLIDVLERIKSGELV